MPPQGVEQGAQYTLDHAYRRNSLYSLRAVLRATRLFEFAVHFVHFGDSKGFRCETTEITLSFSAEGTFQPDFLNFHETSRFVILSTHVFS